MKILFYDCVYELNGIKWPLKNAFESMGHSVDQFDWRDYLYTADNNNLINRIKNRVLFNKISNQINKDFLHQVSNSKYDLLLVARGDHLFKETIEKAKQAIPFVGHYSTDDIFNPLNSTPFMLESFDKYDCIFSPRAHLRDEYLRKGAKSFEVFDWYHLPYALTPPMNIAENKYRYEVSFVGSWSKRREKILTALEGFNVNIFGSGWNRKAKRAFMDKFNCQPAIGMVEMMNVFRSSKININIFTDENRDKTNPRSFDIPAAGGFQLSEKSDSILNYFSEGVEISCYDSGEELQSKCKYYLDNEEERFQISLGGYQRLVNSDYSISNTARQVLEGVARQSVIVANIR